MVTVPTVRASTRPSQSEAPRALYSAHLPARERRKPVQRQARAAPTNGGKRQRSQPPTARPAAAHPTMRTGRARRASPAGPAAPTRLLRTTAAFEHSRSARPVPNPWQEYEQSLQRVVPRSPSPKHRRSLLQAFAYGYAGAGHNGTVSPAPVHAPPVAVPAVNVAFHDLNGMFADQATFRWQASLRSPARGTGSSSPALRASLQRTPTRSDRESCARTPTSQRPGSAHAARSRGDAAPASARPASAPRHRVLVEGLPPSPSTQQQPQHQQPEHQQPQSPAAKQRSSSVRRPALGSSRHTQSGGAPVFDVVAQASPAEALVVSDSVLALDREFAERLHALRLCAESLPSSANVDALAALAAAAATDASLPVPTAANGHFDQAHDTRGAARQQAVSSSAAQVAAGQRGSWLHEDFSMPAVHVPPLRAPASRFDAGEASRPRASERLSEREGVGCALGLHSVAPAPAASATPVRSRASQSLRRQLDQCRASLGETMCVPGACVPRPARLTRCAAAGSECSHYKPRFRKSKLGWHRQPSPRPARAPCLPHRRRWLMAQAAVARHRGASPQATMKRVLQPLMSTTCPWMHCFDRSRRCSPQCVIVVKLPRAAIALIALTVACPACAHRRSVSDSRLRCAGWGVVCLMLTCIWHGPRFTCTCGRHVYRAPSATPPTAAICNSGAMPLAASIPPSTSAVCGPATPPLTVKLDRRAAATACAQRAQAAESSARSVMLRCSPPPVLRPGVRSTPTT